MIVPDDARIKIRAEMSRCGYTIESLCQSADISQTVLRGIQGGRSPLDTFSMLKFLYNHVGVF